MDSLVNVKLFNIPNFMLCLFSLVILIGITHFIVMYNKGNA